MRKLIRESAFWVNSCWDNVNFSRKKPHFSTVYFQIERANWVLNWEQKGVRQIANELNIPNREFSGTGVRNQCVMYTSKYFLKAPKRYLYLSGKNRVAFPYFHGYPNSGDKEALNCHLALKKCHTRIARIQVSHTKMHHIVLETGIAPSKVFQIPIAVNPDFFKCQTVATKKMWRTAIGIPEAAVVIGSFQKDGQGWGKGNEPKTIKGPDIFLETMSLMKNRIPELFVLLSGPGRGFVKAGLENLKIPFKHIFVDHYPDIWKLYQCLDLYVVSSREEGGPKAVLESMISGVPLVTTSVGQAKDLVVHGNNACLVEIEDYEGLAYWSENVLNDTVLRKRIIANGFRTAIQNTYAAHQPMWKSFFDGFVDT